MPRAVLTNGLGNLFLGDLSAVPVFVHLASQFVECAFRLEKQQRLAHGFKLRISGVLDAFAQQRAEFLRISRGERAHGGTMPRRWRTGKVRDAPVLHGLNVHAAGSKLNSQGIHAYLRRMSATQVIEEIQHLTSTEQAEVIQFAYRLDAERMLSGKEIAALAKRMIDATDPVEKLKIRDELTRGFYGGNPDA